LRWRALRLEDDGWEARLSARQDPVKESAPGVNTVSAGPEIEIGDRSPSTPMCRSLGSPPTSPSRVSNHVLTARGMALPDSAFHADHAIALLVPLSHVAHAFRLFTCF